jgi:DNA adenine methylase
LVVLARIKGRFLLSINDVPDTRAAFGAFRIESVETRYTIAGGGWMDAGELIVMGPRADDPIWNGSSGRLI